MKLVLKIDNNHIVTLQIKDPTQVTLGHIVQIVNHNLAPEFHPCGYQNQNKKNFTREQLPHTLSDLGFTQSQVALKAEQKLEQGQNDLSKELLPTTLDSAILMIESITLSPDISKWIINKLGEEEVTDSYLSEKLMPTIKPYFKGLTHLTLPHCMGLTDEDCAKRLECLLTLIKDTPTLKNFEIKKSYFSDENAILLAKVLKGHPIEYLGLPFGRIGMRGATDLIESLKTRVLNLQYQFDEGEGRSTSLMYRLIDALERNTSLEKVIFTKTPYITSHLPLIRNMMHTNKTIVSFEVTHEDNPEQKIVAEEIVALGKHNAEYKELRTILDRIDSMQIFPWDLVMIIYGYLGSLIKYNGIKVPFSDIYKKHPEHQNLEYRFFPSVISSKVTLDQVSPIPLPKLVEKYKSKNKILEVILGVYVKDFVYREKALHEGYQFAETHVETIFKLDKLGIESVKDCIAAKLRLAERFKHLFTFDEVCFARLLSEFETMIRVVVGNTLHPYVGFAEEYPELGSLTSVISDKLRESKVGSIQQLFEFKTSIRNVMSSELEAAIYITRHPNLQLLRGMTRGNLQEIKVDSAKQLSRIDAMIRKIMEDERVSKICFRGSKSTLDWQLSQIEAMIRRALTGQQSRIYFDWQLPQIEENICKIMSDQRYGKVTPVTVGIEVISGDLILKGINPDLLSLLMKNLTINLNQGIYPESLHTLLTSKKFIQPKSIEPSFSAYVGTVLGSSSSSSSSSTTSSSTTSSSCKRFLG